MNTALLKTFGQKARTLLIDGVNRKLHYWSFDKDGKASDQPEPYTGGYLFREEVYNDPNVPHLWKSLKSAIAKEGLQEVAERAAYIWFNRLIALQILSKNGYELPVLQPVNAEEKTPIIVTRARAGQYSFLNATEKERLQGILTDYEQETGAFAILLIGLCHQHPLLQRVFGSIDDYTELLLPDDILQPGGFGDLLNSGNYITDDDYRHAELIGWLYQFYISEKKDLVFKKFKDGKKAEAIDIPAATQIFTPNWIVKYMVENTVGRIWLDKNLDSPTKAGMKYLVEPADSNETPVPIIAEAKDLKLLDPAVGSGHILVEGFDLIYKMYEEEYYPADEAVESILQHNLYGLDIDLRAAQLAQFAVLMRAAKYYPDILQKPITPHIYAMPAPVAFTLEDVQAFLGSEGNSYVKLLNDALHLMQQAQNLGSIMQFDWSKEARNFILQQFSQWTQRTDLDLMQQELLQKMTPYLNVLTVLTQSYEAIAANPPYMGQKNMNGLLKTYVNTNYQLGRSDLLSVFIEFLMGRAINNGRFAFITPPSWMFLSTYEELRDKLIVNYSIDSLLHLSRGAFGVDFGSVSSVIIKTHPLDSTTGRYFRLVERTFQEFHQHHLHEIFKRTLANPSFRFHFGSYNKEANSIEHNENGSLIFYNAIPQINFRKVPGNLIAYWVKEIIFDLFRHPKVENLGKVGKGLDTGDNEIFLRNWHEVNQKNNYWIPIVKGGPFRKWYGNFNHLIFWKDNGANYKKIPGANLRNSDNYFKEGLTWSRVSSSRPSFRYLPVGYIAESTGPCGYFSNNTLLPILGFLNSKVASNILEFVAPTMDFQSGHISKLPIILNRDIEQCTTIVEECIKISKKDWDSRETSKDFQMQPLINNSKNLEISFNKWLQDRSLDFFKLFQNEFQLNTLFILAYGLENEIKADEHLEDISILQEELDYEKLRIIEHPFDIELIPIKPEIPIQQLISYIIGCFMGRYRLDKLGIKITYPNSSIEETAAYNYTSPSTGETHRMEIDEDAIMPLMGSKGNFSDDAVVRLRQFLVAVWGEDTLTSNINFMQECLSLDVEDYLVKKFWAYHVRTYSKKPIYWLFSSKKGAFQALVYMHRMNQFTIEKLREKYLLKHIRFLEQEIARYQSASASLSKAEQKKLDTMVKDLKECEEYDLLLNDKTAAQIEFDLDDGVTRNYELFKGVVAPIK